jgi:plasmid stability protein
MLSPCYHHDSMAQLIVRKLEDKIVRKLKERAAKDGVSMEEETRRILRGSLLEKKVKPKMSLLDYLSTMPNVGEDSDFRIPREDKLREVDLSD